MNKGVKGIVM